MSAELWENSRVGEAVSGATFVGREAEMDLLCGALDTLDSTGARTVLIGGDAGIGKTRLVEEFGDRVRAGGTLVTAGVCTPAEGGGLPYGPVVGVLRDLSRRLDAPTAASILAPARAGARSGRRAAVERDRCRGHTERDRQDQALRVVVDLFHRAGGTIAGRRRVRGSALGRLRHDRGRRIPGPQPRKQPAVARRYLPQRRGRPRPRAAGRSRS